MIVDDEREERDRLVSWIYLIVAGLLEIGWPVGLKMSQEAETCVMGILLAVGFMAASGFCLWMAQKQIPRNYRMGPIGLALLSVQISKIVIGMPCWGT